MSSAKLCKSPQTPKLEALIFGESVVMQKQMPDATRSKVLWAWDTLRQEPSLKGPNVVAKVFLYGR